jgi:hypothetical protein
VAKKPKETNNATPEGAARSAGGPVWDPVDPTFLMGTRSAAPALPLTALPKRLGETISAIASARCVNLDLVAGSMLGIIAGAIGNRVRLSITESRTEPATLFVALVVEPAQGKTEAIDIVNESFLAMQRSAVQEANARVDDIVVRLEQTRNQRARKALAAEGTSPVPDAKHRASGRGQLLLAEATVAGIRGALAATPAGRTIVNDELLTAMSITGGSEMIKARSLMLKSWDAKPHTFINGRDGEITIPALQLTIVGATQPDRVRYLLGPDHDGMASRFLWCAPDVTRVNALAESDGPLDQLITALGRLADIEPNGKPGAYPRLIPVSREARDVVDAANANWNQRMTLASPIQKSLMGRARAQALRLSLNLALGERALSGAELPGGEITGEDAERGVTLVNDYFLPMGERVVTEFGRRTIDAPAVQLARYLARLGKAVVSERGDIRRGVGSPVRDTEEIAQCMEELRLRGIVLPQAHDPAQSGRPSKSWNVNPNLSKLFTTAH